MSPAFAQRSMELRTMVSFSTFNFNESEVDPLGETVWRLG
jgi:hypothetical protein